MPRKPTDESNSPRGGRARPSVGRSSGRDRPDRGSSASRGGGAERSGSPRGSQRFDRTEGAPGRGTANRGRYSNSRTPGDRPFADRQSRRSGRSGPSDRTGPYEGRSSSSRGAGPRRGDRPRSPEWPGRRDASDEAGRSERRPFGDRKPRTNRDARVSGSDRARAPRRGPGEIGARRAFNDDRAPSRGPRTSGASRDTRRRPSESGDARGPHDGDKSGKAKSSVWDSAPSRRRAPLDSPRGEGAVRGRFSGKRAGGPKARPPRREKREGSDSSRGPHPATPQEAGQPQGEELETTLSSWSGNPPTQHEGGVTETPQKGNATPQQDPDSGEQPVRGRARPARGEAGERLQKVLSRAGIGSRREVEEWIRAARITVNGEPAVLGVRVGPSDHVRLDGRLIRQRETGGAARVFLIHRSPGENLQQPVDTPEDSNETADTTEEGVEETRGSGAQSSGTPLLDRMPRRAGRRFIPVSPMPRVDGGLELVTSDGDLASKLQRSMRRLSSEFSVRVHGELSPQGIETIARGELDNGQKLTIERCEAAGGEGSNRWYSLVARGASGKDVRQLFERQGALVSRVLRTQLGSLALDRLLSRGQFRELTPEELEALLAAAEGGAD